ncbi:hydroxyacid dehydrogenase [Candidatus Nomurabacteria bacterium]|nr:hydroxyacid dehydrogenase [Candidatus Nomurabacteria bacterium]
MKIAFLSTESEEMEKIKEGLSEHQLIFVSGDADENSSQIKDVDILSVFIKTKITKEFIDRFTDLKLIATRSMGFDHIDVKAAEEKGIVVVNVPTYGSRTVAEYTFSLILGLSRKSYAAYDRLRENGMTDVKDYEGFDLQGKTIGVIGTGNIGKNVIKIARGFSMKVIAFDVFEDQDSATEIGFEYNTLDNVLKNSDIVTIHVPYIKATHHLISEEKLKLMKKNAFLINTARGEIVDTKALVNALEEKRIAGAGLDVLEGERILNDELDLVTEEINDIDEFQILLADHKLIDMKNVIVTPHIAFNTKEAKEEILQTTIDNIKSFVGGEVKNNVSKK